MASPDTARTAVLRGEADGYDMGKERLMGRQAAGNGFLRAAIQARGDQPIRSLSRNSNTARGFAAIVAGIDPRASVEWIPTDQFGRVSETGVFYLADITVGTHARMRQRYGAAAFSLCGVTHTTASAGAMDEIANLLREPVMTWDALVCTTGAVVETVRRVHEVEADYLRWRHGRDIRLELPQLPIIPLGVHCDDFAISADARATARADLGLDPDTVVALFVGRLIFHGKAHPVAMYQGLQAAATRAGRPVTLIMCGWAPHDGITQAFVSGAAQFAPDVRTIFVEGRDPPKRDQAWAAADLFVSLADNIQETFGLTPIEAMAAGLPVVVTDWNGYRDTVRHGVDGFRIATWAPGPGMGEPLARGHENGALNYDHYCWAAAASTSVDLQDLTEIMSRLVENPDLRRQMGEAGRQRAREVFDWPVIYRQYQDLWADLNARRAAAVADPEVAARLRTAPPAAASRLDPFLAFGHYPTHQIAAATILTIAPGATVADLQAALGQALFSELPAPAAQLETLYNLAAAGPLAVHDAAIRMSASLPTIARAAGVLAKIGVVRLG